MVLIIADIPAAIYVNGDTGRGSKRSLSRRPTISAESACSVTCHCGDDAIRTYPTNSIVFIISDIQTAICANCDSVRIVKRSLNRCPAIATEPCCSVTRYRSDDAI